MSFTHLQVRSGYSLMNSTITIDKLVKQVKAQKMSAVALTDENVLYGAISFYQSCLKHGIKPIIGMTIQVVEGEELQSCILLAKNNNGYQHLMKLSTLIQEQVTPYMEKENLAPHIEDVIGILPAMDKPLHTLLRHNPYEEVAAYLQSWQNMFDKDDLYLGIQDHGLDEERKLHPSIKAFHESYRVPVVAINDVRYLQANDDLAYDCLQAMKKGKKWMINQANQYLKQRHLRSESEMEALFSTFWPNVLDETNAISQKCQVTFDFDKRMLPAYPVPNEMDAHTYLEQLCWDNVKQKYNTITESIKERLTYELHTIQSMQFSDYFLIVWDFISYARNQQIMVGPGRGSAAGSLVAYVLGITDVDPIKYELLFERFLNPERVTMPDIDIDFSDHRRDEVIKYVRDKYGSDHVAQIITFGTFAARSLLRELIKTMGISQEDANYLLNKIPVQANQSIVDYVKQSDDLQTYIKKSNSLKALFSVAVKLEGLPRHVSTHAAGIVISESELVNHVPLIAGTNDLYVTQFPMNDLEAIGLLKMDFLGLRNLTLIERIISTISYVSHEKVNMTAIPENDQQTYQLLQNGETNGIFQLESKGMKQVLKRLKPSSFEDIVAVNALYRPGPMEYIPVYIDRKHKRQPITYPHPDLETILEKTYGVLIYQEQIMQIAHQIAGFSLGQADILRRAVSKKQQDVMAKQKYLFIQGCLDNGYSQQISEQIFSWIVKFSNYGFNRSHAVAYSKIAYQLAFLKAHYPLSFYAELLSSVMNQQDKVQQYIQEIKERGITLRPPSINKSYGKYSVDKQAIRMGLLAIKGIGNQVMKEIIQVRKSGPFKSIFDFCLRIDPKVLNRQTLELLIMAGAFDETYSNRASLLASIDQAIERADLFRDLQDQPSFFDNMMEQDDYVEIEDFSTLKKLADEKELLGVYVSSHPLASYRSQLRANGYVTLKQAVQLVDKKGVKSAAIVQSIKKIRTKRGDSMAFLTISDEMTEMEAVVFPDLYRDVSGWLTEEMMIVFEGRLEYRKNKIQCLLSFIEGFTDISFKNKQNKRLFVKVTNQDSDEAIKWLYSLANAYPGDVPIIIYHPLNKQTYQLSADYFINPSYKALQRMYAYFGKENVVLD
ncbi:DNA polymerase III subunit alpha [Oceanobacillus halotolerans]|uniref:DNA polymerase III subunit alpha n=1 Tax=Oceanobacillus halotolerans TaxID=2663380 RepID=UPI0013DD22F8|nr:DNA polymerase III subunit alpha [Oceanobacillus halotolerans]